MSTVMLLRYGDSGAYFLDERAVTEYRIPGERKYFVNGREMLFDKLVWLLEVKIPVRYFLEHELTLLGTTVAAFSDKHNKQVSVDELLGMKEFMWNKASTQFISYVTSLLHVDGLGGSTVSLKELGITRFFYIWEDILPHSVSRDSEKVINNMRSVRNADAEYLTLLECAENNYRTHYTRMPLLRKRLGSKNIIESIAEFYILMALSITDSSARALYARLVEKLSERLLNYMVAASVGEARHAVKYAELTHGLSPAAAALALGGSNMSRDAMHIAGLLLLEGGKSVEEILHACDDLFALEWAGSYGGERWQACTSRVLEYVRGEISPVLFIDTMSDLQHNGGWVWGKYFSDRELSMSTFKYMTVMEVLDIKQEDALGLLSYFTLSSKVENLKLVKEWRRENGIPRMPARKLRALREANNTLSYWKLSNVRGG